MVTNESMFIKKKISKIYENPHCNHRFSNEIKVKYTSRNAKRHSDSLARPSVFSNRPGEIPFLTYSVAYILA